MINCEQRAWAKQVFELVLCPGNSGAHAGPRNPGIIVGVELDALIGPPFVLECGLVGQLSWTV
jgi:hypothetical protein